MTPEEELKGLNKLIRQYETVYRTTSDPDQKGRAEKQLKDLRGYKEKILAVNVIDGKELEDAPRVEDDMAATPLLKQLRAQNAKLPPGKMVKPLVAEGVTPSSSQRDVFHLALYVAHFEREFLPFLTEKKLKLDFKFSMDRDGFYNGFQSLQRKIADYREENNRIAGGTVSRDMELEMRKRALKLTRVIAVDGARFFRAVERFAAELAEDAGGDAVKCLNCDDEISFDTIEGKRLLEGQKVNDALETLRDFAAEAVAYLNIPEIETQES